MFKLSAVLLFYGALMFHAALAHAHTQVFTVFGPVCMRGILQHFPGKKKTPIRFGRVSCVLVLGLVYSAEKSNQRKELLFEGSFFE